MIPDFEQEPRWHFDPFPCTSGEGVEPADKHLTAQFWTSSEPYKIITYTRRPPMLIRAVIEDGTVTWLSLCRPRNDRDPFPLDQERPAGPDLVRAVETYWNSHEPSHMNIHRAIWAHRARMRRLHTTYRRKRLR